MLLGMNCSCVSSLRPLEWGQKEEECLKNALITSLVLSMLLFLAGILSFMWGIGTAASGTWTLLSAVLTFGVFLLAIQSCLSQKSQNRTSLSFQSPLLLREALRDLDLEELYVLDQWELSKSVEHLSPDQIRNFDYSLVEEEDLANELLSSPHSCISSDQVNAWLESGMELKPEFLAFQHIQGLFRGENTRVDQSLLTRDLCGQLDEEQIEFLLKRTDLCLKHIPPEKIRRVKLTIEQADRLFLKFDERNKERLPQLDQTILNQLIADNWVSYVLEGLSSKQISNIPFVKIRPGQLEAIFPVYNEDILSELVPKMEAIASRNIRYLIHDRKLSGLWLMILSRSHIQSLDFSLLTSRQLDALFPTFRTGYLPFAKERYRWLLQNQKEFVPIHLRRVLQ